MKYIIILVLIFTQLLSYSQGIDLTVEYMKNISKLKGDPKAQAIIDLGKLSDPSSINQLTAYSKDPTDATTRAAAITAVQWVRINNSYGIALEALNDPADDVKLAAIQSLSVITNELHGWIFPGIEATTAITKLYASSKVLNIRIAALSYLITKNNPQVNSIIISAIDDPAPEIRLIAAASPLLKANPEKLTKLINDKNNDVKALLASIAGNMKSKQGFDILKELIKDDSPQIKSAALQALINYKSDETKEIIMPFQFHDDIIVAAQAILSAAELGYADYTKLQERFSTEKRLPIKMAIINSMHWAADKVATDFLLNVLSSAKTEFPDNFISSVQIITDIITSKCKEITPELTAASSSKEAEIRTAAAIILGNIKNADSITLLKKLSADEEIPVRICAINSLSAINSPESIALLLTLLSDRVPAVKKAVIRGLAQCKYKPANDNLLKLITDNNTSVAIEAVMALGTINADATTITANLLGCYQKAPMPVQTAIIYALGYTGDKRIAPYLHELFADAPKEMQIAIILACGKINDDWIIAKIVELMKGSYQYDIDIKKASAEALSNFNDEDALQLLNYFVYNPIPIVRNAAIWSLAKKNNNNAKSILVTVIFNTKADYADRAAAIGALNTVKDDAAIKMCKDVMKFETNPQMKLAALTALVNNDEPSLQLINDWAAQTTNPELAFAFAVLKMKAK